MKSKTSTKAKPRALTARRTQRSASPARLFVAADITDATLRGYREGRAAAIAERVPATLDALIAAPTSIADPIKVLADGTHCAPGDTRTDHVAVLLPAAGIMVHPVSLGAGGDDPLQNHAACEGACRDLRVLGHSDWQLASREDWNHILDLTRHDPAVDPNLYPGIKPRWHWTSTAAAWSASSAWFVLAGGGGVDYGPRDSDVGFALAVRRVGQ
ncbi:MAG: Lcl domain-containing protein [Dokdonella sp.]|uniref:Lcl domain-containing protein n=1 Tax=Dokdonella sp. TaxID=2291710 RepID=UPI003F7D1D71